MITDRAINALAAFIAEQRPDWQPPGIVAALRAERDSDPWQLAQRMLKRASDPANTAPRLQKRDLPLLVGCRRHPGAPVRTDGTCGVCWAESHAAEGAAPRFVRSSPSLAAVEARRRLGRREEAKR